jgi:hypothetical protein
VEFVSNFAWLAGALVVLVATSRGVRRGTVRLSMASAIMLAILLCFILLPVISVNDDLLLADQAALPFSAQIWRIASEDASVGLNLLFAIVAYLLMVCFGIESLQGSKNLWNVRPLAARLARSQRLRPPLCVA